MNEVFVFGSNLAGHHGKGAALYAKMYYGAIQGQGIGRQGNSYGIPTKGWRSLGYPVLPLWSIKEYVDQFIDYAINHDNELFLLTPIGCGLAGYTREQIQPMFWDAPDNVIFLKEWDEV